MKQIILLCMILAQVSAFSQQPPAIEVNGFSEREVVPDVIVIAIRLKEYEEDRQKIDLEKIDQEFLNVVNNSGISKDNIELYGLTASAYIYKRKEHTIYSQKTYHIRFASSKGVMDFLDQVKNVRLDYVGIVKLTHTEIEKIRLELRRDALHDAETKAHQMLSSLTLGESAKLGKPILIRDVATNHKGPHPVASDHSPKAEFSTDFDNVLAMGENEIPIRKITIQLTIETRWQIL